MGNVTAIHIDQDKLGQEIFPEGLRDQPGRYNSRKPGPKFWDWEKQATEHLKKLGYTVIKDWWSSDGDDFGPLIRSIIVSKDGQKFGFWYG